jgi:hypothetical protein
MLVGHVCLPSCIAKLGSLGRFLGSMYRSILVTGATGRQGGCLIKALLATPIEPTIQLFALSRNPRSPAARKLKDQGVTIIEGDLNNVSAIFENSEVAKQPLWGIFGVQVTIYLPFFICRCLS